MEEEYDVVVCGTGLVECILSGLLSQESKIFKFIEQKVLHIDRNPFYGGEGASLNITNLFEKFKNTKTFPEQYGKNRDWNVDLIPKFVMSDGNLVKILLKTQVEKYLDWQPISQVYVYQNVKAGLLSKGGGKIFKVPSTPKEALESSLMGLFEKRRFKNFLAWVNDYDTKNPQTYKKVDPMKISMNEIFQHFELEPNTIDFVGHAVALYTNDQFINQRAYETILKIKLYINSVGLYGETPFIYPVYGLGGIPEGFSRMCAIYGGTFMLNTDINEIVIENNKVKGVKQGEKFTPAKMVICDPSYAIKCGLENRVKKVSQIIRCICILDHPIPGTKDVPSVQIIIPQRQLERKSDIFIAMVSNIHSVCKKGYYVAIISTNIETNNPQQEILPALELIGNVKEKFVSILDQYEATSEKIDGLFISDSMSPQSHFELEVSNVMNLYKQITGKDLDLVNIPQRQEE